MYERLPTVEEAAEAGFVPEDYASDPVEPFPDNVQALRLFEYMRTQWRMGPSGPCGLDYGVMHQKMGRMGLAPDDFDQLETDMQIMEQTALGCIYEKK